MMEWLRAIQLPKIQGSDFAKEIDFVYMSIFWLSVVLFLGIVGAAAYFSWRYRYVEGRATPHQTHNTTLEILWSVLPLLLCVGLFFWGLVGYMKFAVAPGEAMEITVTGEKWLWSFEYPDGTRSAGEMHVPIGKPVHLVMGSKDVLHDFFIPDMRIKRDIVPGRYTEIWFTPTVMGEHLSTCAEYCGKGHSDMKAKVFVDTQEKYEEWIATGGTEWMSYPPEEWGKIQWKAKGCESCHNLDGTRSKGPSWKAIAGKMEKLQGGQSVLVDDNYLRESMLQPQAKIVEGFEPVMPTFQGLLKEPDIRGLIAFIKSLK